MGLKQRINGNWNILDIEGTFGKIEIKLLKAICSNSVKNKEILIAVNFKQIELLDSTGLGALIHCDKLIKGAGGSFVLINLNENIYNLLEMTTVDKMLTIRENEHDLEV